jgi:hypothetical protein
MLYGAVIKLIFATRIQGACNELALEVVFGF